MNKTPRSIVTKLEAMARFQYDELGKDQLTSLCEVAPSMSVGLLPSHMHVVPTLLLLMPFMEPIEFPHLCCLL